MKRPASTFNSPGERLVRYLEFAIQQGSRLGGEFTEAGALAQLAKLRAAVRFAPAIAFGDSTFDSRTLLAANATDAMDRAAMKIRGIKVDEEARAEDPASEDPQTLYLLGLLVGFELAGGAR